MKIVMAPLDERPCNYNYPLLMPAAGYSLILPPRDMLGDKKRPADLPRLHAWLIEETKDADACILSLDMLLYGGIVPSRLHHESLETLKARSSVVETLKRNNPALKLYLFQLIMRCPDYSLSDEEPEYYDVCGRELHLLGRYTHRERLGILTDEEREDLARVQACIPPEVLRDFSERRRVNREALLWDLRFAKDGTADYFIVPQDDAAVYGFTTMDQLAVREYLKENRLHLRTAMYPSADDTGLILLARAIAEARGARPKVFVKYASEMAGAVVPWFEDRPLAETIKYHLLAAHCTQVYSLAEADILLAVNMGSAMTEENDPRRSAAYDVERNLAEFVSYLEYALACGKRVAVADVATCNGADGELFGLLYDEDLLLRLDAYAGWNTSSNTIGTAVCQSVLSLLGGDDAGRIRFLLHRYYEDMAYMGAVRAKVTERLPALGLDYFHADGARGTVARFVKEEIVKYMGERFPLLAAHVKDVDVSMPWRRMFEADIRLTPGGETWK